MGPVYHLLYTSRKANTLSDKQLIEIIKSSVARNAKRHITGFLIEREGYFMQLLEGLEDDVLELFTRIEVDPRHDEIIIQAEGSSRERLVPDWHMERIIWDPATPHAEDLLEVYRRGREALPYTHREEMMRILEQFATGVRKRAKV
jgi:hypothetical protein